MKLNDFPGIQRNVPLRGYSTFNVGGHADYFFNVKDTSVLAELMAVAKEDGVPVFTLGGGSNVLFSDEGFRGLIVLVSASEARLEGNKLIADGGARWNKILELVKDANLQGVLEFDGLPGTIGGAVSGNAGCFGVEIKDTFESAKIYDRESGEVREVGPDYFEFKYRWSKIRENFNPILEVTLVLEPRDENAVEPQTVRNRIDKQPPGRSSGSFFKNPSTEQPAGLLIDQAGLKGHQIGGAQISPKHANFFMNVGGATTADLLALRDLAKEKVRQKFGIELEEEVRIIS
jgi:UDP-N-acetylmuramate dehydrogenase